MWWDEWFERFVNPTKSVLLMLSTRLYSLGMPEAVKLLKGQVRDPKVKPKECRCRRVRMGADETKGNMSKDKDRGAVSSARSSMKRDQSGEWELGMKEGK